MADATIASHPKPPPLDWLTQNIATTPGEIQALNNASDKQVNGLYQQWDQKIQQAQVPAQESGAAFHPTRDFVRDASGALVLYRGGQNFSPKAGEYKLEPDGTVKTTRGVSVNTDPAKVERFGGAYEIKSMPSELTAVQRGLDPGHYELVPVRRGMTMENVVDALERIVTEAAEKP